MKGNPMSEERSQVHKQDGKIVEEETVSHRPRCKHCGLKIRGPHHDQGAHHQGDSRIRKVAKPSWAA
jgi:hypothetical protein